MQRLLSSCIRSRSLIYPPPRSFLISARVKSSTPSIVLSKELSNKAIDTAERASATTPSSSDNIWSERSKKIMEEVSRSPPADAFSGRTVDNSRDDLAGAFRTLESILVRNRVRYQLRLSHRHEKKGAKRRRLKSERWRKQFANEVRKKVKLVVKIRKRGA